MDITSKYNESINRLTEYMKKNEQNPNESKWNRIAVKEGYLSAESIGYIYGKGFNKLCRNIRKEINYKK